MFRKLAILATLAIAAITAHAEPVAPGNAVTSRANKFTATQTFSQSISNYTPGTTRQATIENPSGSWSWIDFLFGANYRAAIGANSSGQLNLHYGAGQCTYFNRGTTSYTTDAAMCPGRLYVYGYGNFRDGVNAGGNSDPTSMLQTQGSLGLKTVVMTASGTIPSTATVILCDGSTAAGCIGTPTYQCSHWTNQTDCELRNSHGGCVYTTFYCSTYNGNIYDCQNDGRCTLSQTNCSDGGAYDQYSCEALDDSYGGNCAWNNNPINCNIYDSDESNCNANSSYCYFTASTPASCYGTPTDCGAWNGDEFTCLSQPQCGYDSGMSTCYNNITDCNTWNGSSETCTAAGCSHSAESPSTCSGEIPNYTCDGQFNNGNCNGSAGVCGGTSSCNPISQGNCPSEPGCNYASVINANLYNGVNDRTIKIVNDASNGADCVINAAAGETVKNAASHTLSNFGQEVWLTYFFRQESCSSFNEGQCTPTGCYPDMQNCSWDSMNNICSGNSVCDPISDQSTCESQQYFNYCAGNYTISKNWY